MKKKVIESPKTVTRSWKMWAHEQNGEFQDVSPDKWWVELHGEDQISRVEVVEDADGCMSGWLETGSSYPVMIWHKQVFEMCFPYGTAVEVAAGRGVVLQLSIKRIADEN